MMRPLSWSMRFALSLSAVFVIATLAAGGLAWLFVSQELTRRLQTDVQSAAQALAGIAGAGDRTDLSEQVVAQARAVRDGATLYAFVDGQTGKITGSLQLAAPFEGARVLLPHRDFPPPASSGRPPEEAYLGYGIRTPLGWVIVAHDTEGIVETGEIMIRATGAATVAALILSLGLALFIARRTGARIGRMESVLDAIGSGNLARRIGDDGNDDLADLARRVDLMLDRLQASIAAIRQVSTDVAHDLRAPLARLRMRLEPHALSAAAPATIRAEIGQALEDIDGISATFDAILRLSRLESGTVEVRSETVDLTALARSVHDILEPAASDRGHSLMLDIGPGKVTVTGDRDLLMQALVNLVDNALRHCPLPARVTLSLGEGPDGPTLAVDDDGPGIPAADRARVLERFVRLDASRTVPGSGLGLSLVAAIARHHGAGMSLSDNHPGLRVSLTFGKG